MELIVFPGIIIPLLKAHSAQEGKSIGTLEALSIRVLAFNRRVKVRLPWKGEMSSWNDKEISSYFPRLEWLTRGALRKMIVASTQPVERWRRWGNERLGA